MPLNEVALIIAEVIVNLSHNPPDNQSAELAPEKRSPWLIVYNQLWREFSDGTSTGAIHA